MTFSLTGNWQYCTEDRPEFALPGFDDTGWPRMQIPQNWFLGGLDHHGVVWYRHVFHHKPKANFATLRFEGVDYSADVYLNGQLLGTHSGYFEPFEFDVTKILRPGRNLLAVRVDSPYEQPGPNGWHIRKRLIKGILNHHDCRPGGGWDPQAGQSDNTGGIWNRVSLEEHGPLTIGPVLLRADFSGKKPVLHVQLSATNRTVKRDATLEINCAPENFKGKIQSARFTLHLPEGQSRHTFQTPLADIKLWQPWDRGFPHLYNITTTLKAQKNEATAASLFGFRTVKVEEGFRWVVNGQPYFMRGSNYIGSQWLAEMLFPEIASSKTHPFGGSAGGDPFERDIDLARRANLNILRVHAHVLPPEFHTACDRAGLLVWQDFPLQWGYTDEPDFQAEARRQFQAMVTQLYNHPSIIAWCCHNETPWDSPWMADAAGGSYDPAQNRQLDQDLEAIGRELDPTRYVHRASGAGDRHTYPGWYDGHWRGYRDLSGAPFITEYGAQGLPVKASLQRMLPQYGPDTGFSELVKFKDWLESSRKTSSIAKFLIQAGVTMHRFTEKQPRLIKITNLLEAWAVTKSLDAKQPLFDKIPPIEEIPQDLLTAREIWQTWRYHNMQFQQTFEHEVAIGASLDEFIANSQAYQNFIIQYGTETFRRAKYAGVTGVIQFDFTDPWPAITWSVLDYWRTAKPAFDVLRRSMQPVLPSFQLPEKIEPGKAALTSFRVVNDLTESFPGVTCDWHLANEKGDLASATFPIDVPADGVSEEVKLTLPSLSPGKYTFSVSLISGETVIGENRYDIVIDASPIDLN
jgi:beta-mannosidase